MGLTLLGTNRSSGKSIFLAESRQIEELPQSISLPSPRFVLFLAYDEQKNASHLKQVLAELLEGGCVYLCAWGPGCEHVHDTMDDVALEHQLTGHPERHVMTTWHDTESLEEAARFALQCATPDSTLAEGCSTVVLAAVGNQEWTARLHRLATDYVSL
jgi:hypothetical protein